MGGIKKLFTSYLGLLHIDSVRSIFRIFFILILPLAVMIAIADGLLIPKVKDAYVKPRTPNTAVPVSLFLVKDTKSDLPVTYTGNVTPKLEAVIAAKVMAKVEQVNFDAGSHVQQGDLLIRLESNDLRAQVAQAASQVSAGQAALKQAEVAYRQAQTDFARDQMLYANGAITQYDYQHAEDLVSEDQSAVSAAQAQLEAYQSSYEYAETMLGYTRIYAPFSGIIAKKDVNIGDMATPGNELCVEEGGPYRLDVPIPESYEQDITTGDKVEVDIPAVHAHVVGNVYEVVPVVSPSSMTYLVKILLPANLDVRSGMYGNATFTVGKVQDIFIPRTALVKWGDFDGVFADDNGVARLEYVTIGTQAGNKVQILSGLSNNEVIVRNAANIQDGEKIEGELKND